MKCGRRWRLSGNDAATIPSLEDSNDMRLSQEQKEDSFNEIEQSSEVKVIRFTEFERAKKRDA